MAVALQWEVAPPPNLAVYFSGEDLLPVAFGWCMWGFGLSRHGARACEKDRAVALGDAAASMVVGRCPEHGWQVVAMLQLRSCVCPACEEEDARTAVLRRGCGGTPQREVMRCVSRGHRSSGSERSRFCCYASNRVGGGA
jgi:hypothetical protein